MPFLFSVWLTAGQWLIWLVGGIALVATLMPLLRSTAWWIRVCDFPRLQIVAGLLLALGAEVWLTGGFGETWAEGLFEALLAGAAGYQLLRFFVNLLNQRADLLGGFHLPPPPTSSCVGSSLIWSTRGSCPRVTGCRP